MRRSWAAIPRISFFSESSAISLEFAASTLFTMALLAAFALALGRDLETAIGVFAIVSIGGHAAILLWARMHIAQGITNPAGATA